MATQRSGSTSAEVMAWSGTKPLPLCQCWLVISDVLWRPPEINIITFQGGIRMKVHVVDSDDTSGDDRVDDLFVTYRATPDASLAFASPHPVTITGTRSNSPTKLVPYWNGNVILTNFLSLDEPKVPIWTSDSVRDKKISPQWHFRVSALLWKTHLHNHFAQP